MQTSLLVWLVFNEGHGRVKSGCTAFSALAAQHAKCSLHPAGMQSDDGFGSPTYPANQPGYLRHSPSVFQQSSHTTPAEAFFSKEVLDPPAKTGTILPAQY